MLDIDFGSASDDNLEPQSLCAGINQDFQDTWATSIVSTLVKCVNDKNESVLRMARKGVDKSMKREPFIDSGVRFGLSQRCFATMAQKGGKIMVSL